MEFVHVVWRAVAGGGRCVTVHEMYGMYGYLWDLFILCGVQWLGGEVRARRRACAHLGASGTPARMQ